MSLAVKKHRFSLTTGLACALVAAWYLVVHVPKTNEAAQLKISIDDVSNHLSLYQQDLGTAEQVADSSRSLQQTWNGLTLRLVNPENADEVLTQIRQAASHHGITVLDIDLDLGPILKQLSEPTEQRPLSRVRVSLEGRGRYFDIGEFVRWLENDITIAQIDEVQIHYRKAVDPEVYFAVSSEVFVMSATESVF